MDVKIELRDQVTFLVWPLFQKDLKYLGEGEELQEGVIQALLVRPDSGVLLPGGIRKIRYAAPKKNKGKSGGYRVLYFLATAKVFHLISILDKSDADNFDKKFLAALVKTIKQSRAL